MLVDLTKAFETVSHQALIDAATKKGYPLLLLKLALDAYRIDRAIGIDGTFSQRLKATQGITAGSALATTELKLLLLDVIAEVNTNFGGDLGVTLYVDDLTISARGSTACVTSTLARATDQVVAHFQRLGMIVSQKKSVVVASSHATARRIASYVTSRAIRPRSRAKLLGVGTAGGNKRCMKTIKARVEKLSRMVPRLRQLRRQRVNTRLMARTCGTAAMTYGTDCQGVSDTLLQTMRTTAAAAASSGAGGKNVDRSLHIIAGLKGSLDPAVEVFSLGLKRWATAWWEAWTTRESMIQAFEGACARCSINSYRWRAVAGPAAALAVSLTRIGWNWVAADTFIDDLGREWSATHDPPICIVQAARRAVRRWRLQRIAKDLPGLMPVSNDLDDEWMTGSSAVIDLSHITSRLATGKVSKLRQTPEWNRSHAPSLLSATTGGQWTQARRAAVPKFGITDNRCQLCFDAVGTADHRWTCRHIRPQSGWSAPSSGAEKVAERLGHRRMKLLDTHGILVLRVPPRPWVRHDTFTWLSLEPPADAASMNWYIDGSGQNAKWDQLATFGFGIVVTDADNNLVAWGYGTPPHWAMSAADAEAWALCVALRWNLGVPKIITDCKALLSVARAGASRACAADMPLARTWGHIVSVLDGSTENLCGESLVWMPSHLSSSNFRQAQRSDGRSVSANDWRANRLADALAKVGASCGQAPNAVSKLIRDAGDLVRHRTGILGAATHEANNCLMQVIADDGTSRTIRCRDAQQPQNTRLKGAGSRTKNKIAASKIVECSDDIAESYVPPRDEVYAGRRAALRRAKAAAAKRRRAEEVYALEHCIASRMGCDRPAASVGVEAVIATGYSPACQPCNSSAPGGDVKTSIHERISIVSTAEAERMRQRPQRACGEHRSASAVNAAMARLMR